MADYWKSNPRKFCDICKCWFADNRSSIEFHERGKRHQEAARARLADLARRGRQDHIQQQQMEADMQRMEEAAMAAFKKDLAGNPELARQYGVKVSRKPGALGPGEEGPTLDGAPLPREEGPSMDGAPLPSENPEPAPVEAGKKWHEAKSDQGYSYYWNVDTGEAVWEPPDEGYVALPDCAPPEPIKREPGAVTQEPRPVKTEPDAVKQEPEEPPPPGDDVTSRTSDVRDRTNDVKGRSDPYGSGWETVHKQEPAPPVDLQLPEQHQPRVQPAAPRDKTRIVFRQKAVASLGAGDETFKKRRVEGEKRRNIRQRTDDS